MGNLSYFRNVHNRNSYDNNGAVLKNYVHANLVAMGYSNNDNAFWDGSRMTYGDGTSCDILTALDITAHEIGHGVCKYSVDSPNGLVYRGESGAINESLSDIWGVCVENWATTNKQTWLMGEDIGCIARSSSNPKSYNQPNTYGGTYWWTPSDLSWDNGGVIAFRCCLVGHFAGFWKFTSRPSLCETPTDAKPYTRWLQADYSVRRHPRSAVGFDRV